MKRRVLFVGRTRYDVPLGITHANKFDALGRVFDYHVIGTQRTSAEPPPDLELLAPRLFYPTLIVAVARALRSFAPDVVVAQSPFEGVAVLVARRIARSRAKVIVEIHGDWHTAARLYGSSARRVLAPAADLAASSAVRRADAVRVVSDFTADLVRKLGVEPAAMFHTYTDIGPFVDDDPHPLPAEPRLAFVGVLERYKNIDGLAEAWRSAARTLPGVTLELVGDGRLTTSVEQLLADVPAQTVWHRKLEPVEVSALLDRSWALVLPSFSEGLPRVAIEAFARGRPVVGSRAGGIPDAVSNERNGLLVPPGDDQALADALQRLVTEEGLAARLAQGARDSVGELITPPDAFADHMAELVELTLSRS